MKFPILDNLIGKSYFVCTTGLEDDLAVFVQDSREGRVVTEAVHIKEVEHDRVAIDSLRVLVDGNDSEGWMAQGLEIDYFVCAKTEKSVKENFVKGLVKTIAIYLEEDESISDLLKPAPKEVWQEFCQAMSGEQKSVSVCVDFVPAEHLFFNQIAFLSSRNENSRNLI